MQCKTEHTGVQSNDKEAERQARNREYQRNYRAKLRAKANANEEHHPNPNMMIANNIGLITNLKYYCSTIKCYIFEAKHTEM